MKKSKIVEYFERYQCSPNELDNIFTAIASKYINDELLILDAGCGSKTMVKAKNIIGIDSDTRVKHNEFTQLIHADLEQMPFWHGTFDVILCYMVIEHMSNPRECFKEFARVCKDGAVAIVATPNERHYANWLVKETSYDFHKWFASKVLGSMDDCPTHYLANTTKKLKIMMEDAGFDTVAINTYDTMPMHGYLGWCPPAYVGALLYHRLVRNTKSLEQLRGDIIGVFEIAS